MSGKLPESSLRYVLEGLVPYTEANLKLAFKPHAFFNDLERISQRKRRTLQNAYYKAQKDGLLVMDAAGVPRLTDKGRAKIAPYKPRALGKQARLVVIFDVPEIDRWKRRHLRLLLRELSFRQVQKSVWESKYDYRDYLKSEIIHLGLQEAIIVYEALPVITA